MMVTTENTTSFSVYFSPQVAAMVKEHYPSASVTMSHQVGQMGTLERENAAILNESLKPLCKVTVTAFREALDKLGLACPFYLTQNDGTLIRYTYILELIIQLCEETCCIMIM